MAVKDLMTYMKYDGIATFISFMMGIGIAAMFRPLCKGPDCVVMRGPPVQDVRNSVYQFGKRCVEFRPTTIECPTGPNAPKVVDTVSFADYD
jgi:hypothetical protein